ncbi:MAG: hypothetical protein A2Y17_00650 [Clostridiales bacterium GWF2_38_85]|nr:MAG: hypothetical protein A2Y17_00650 [Clostridiales bacterium GWF2_38_85]
MKLNKNSNLTYIKSSGCELIIFDKQNNTTHIVDKFGIELLKFIDNKNLDINELIETMKNRYPSNECINEIRNYINMLLKKEILVYDDVINNTFIL